LEHATRGGETSGVPQITLWDGLRDAAGDALRATTCGNSLWSSLFEIKKSKTMFLSFKKILKNLDVVGDVF
jgi:hypothetical protein